jgi:hypothetical protein
MVRRIPVGIISAGTALDVDVTGQVSIGAGDPTMFVLPAPEVCMTSDRALQANEAAAIDVIELFSWETYTAYKPDDTNVPRASAVVWRRRDAPYTVRTWHADDGKGERRFSVDVPYWDTGTNNNFAGPILTEYANRLNDLNDRWYLPPLRIDFAHAVPSDVSVLDAVLRTRPSIGVNMAMPGSIYTGLDRTTPAYQLIAGKLRWTRQGASDARWVLDGKWAPVAAGGQVTTANLTLGQLATTSEATLGDVDDITTLGDLRHVTKGLS